MAFKPNTYASARSSVTEWYPGTNNEALVLGEAVVLTAGAFAKCAATSIPSHIMAKSATGDGATLLPAYKITSSDEFETSATAAPAVGEKVTLHTDGLTVTDTTSSGVFLLSYVGTGGTPVVRGRFPGA